MKVCHLIASKGLGRGEAYIDLVNALCAHIEVVLLVPQGALFLPRVDKKIQIITYSSRDSRKNPFLFYELYCQMKEIKPDIVHTHFAKATEIYYILNKVQGLPWIGTKHNSRKGRIFNKINQVIAVSKGVADSITHERIRIIHNGLSPVTIPRVVEKNQVFTILAVGRLEKVKAFDRLLTECSNLTFDFKLLIVGDGPEKTNLVSLANSLNINKNVDFLGYRTDVPNLMQQSDVIVVCSHSEGFSIVILEGLFYGKILISRSVGIAGSLLPEMFLIEKYEITSKLEEVFKNTDSFKNAFIAVRELQEPKYLITNSAEEHIVFYRQMLSKKRES